MASRRAESLVFVKSWVWFSRLSLCRFAHIRRPYPICHGQQIWFAPNEPNKPWTEGFFGHHRSSRNQRGSVQNMDLWNNGRIMAPGFSSRRCPWRQSVLLRIRCASLFLEVCFGDQWVCHYAFEPLASQQKEQGLPIETADIHLS